jgi:hypothetical protein
LLVILLTEVFHRLVGLYITIGVARLTLDQTSNSINIAPTETSITYRDITRSHPLPRLKQASRFLTSSDSDSNASAFRCNLHLTLRQPACLCTASQIIHIVTPGTCHTGPDSKGHFDFSSKAPYSPWRSPHAYRFFDLSSPLLFCLADCLRLNTTYLLSPPPRRHSAIHVDEHSLNLKRIQVRGLGCAL